MLLIAAMLISMSFFSCMTALCSSDQKLVVGEVWTMGSVDPAMHSYELNNFLVAEGLTSISPDFKIVPCLADSWETSGSDSWRFHLNKDIKFHDGSKLTADDVVSALQRTMKMNPSVTGQLNIKKITKVDDYTLDITTNTSDASLPARMAYGRASIYKINEDGDGTISTPICTGPFKFVSYDKASDTLELAKNELYREGAPKLDAVTGKPHLAV